MNNINYIRKKLRKYEIIEKIKIFIKFFVIKKMLKKCEKNNFIKI